MDMIQHTIRDEIKKSFALSIPLVAAQLIYASSSFLGVAMIAHLGEAALAASVLVNLIWMSLTVLFLGILNSISILVAHQFGARDEKSISGIMGQAFILGFFVSLAIILALCIMPYFMRFSSQPALVLKWVNDYLFSLIWSVPALVILIILEQFLAGIGRTKLVLRISLMVVPLEIPLIYIFIFGKLGVPALGVAGEGYGLAVTFTVSAICLIWYLLKHPYYRKYHLFAKITSLKWFYLKELICLGLPIGFMQLIEVSTFAIATFFVAQFGTQSLAAHQTVMQYLGFTINIVFAMSQAVTIRVGHAIGMQDVSGVKYATYIGMLLNFVCVILISGAFYFFPRYLLQLDLDIHLPDNQTLIQQATQLLSICALLFIFDNFRIMGYGTLRGLKDGHFGMLASFVSFWLVGLSSSFIFGFLCHGQAAGIWWGLTLGIFCGALFILVRLQRQLRRLQL